MTDDSRTTLTELAEKAAGLFGATLPDPVREFTTKVDDEVASRHADEEKPEPASDGDIGPVAVVRARNLINGDTVYIEDTWAKINSEVFKGVGLLGTNVAFTVRMPASFPARLRVAPPGNRLMMIRPRP